MGGQGKGARAMSEEKNQKKNEDSVKKLEKEFHEFQIQWVKFVNNDFHHLVEDVTTLIKQNDKQHGEIQQ